MLPYGYESKHRISTCSSHYISHGTTHRPHPVSPSRNYSRILAPIGAAGCITEWVGVRDHYRRPKKQECRNTSVDSDEVCCNSKEFRMVCNSHDEQRWTHLQCITSVFNAKSNGSTGLRDWICPTARTNEHMYRQIFGNPRTLPRGILIYVEPDLPEVIVHLDQAATDPSKEGK